MIEIPPLERQCNSWVVIRLATGEAVFETWDRRLLEKLDPTKAKVLTAYSYLCGLNRERSVNIAVDAATATVTQFKSKGKRKRN